METKLANIDAIGYKGEVKVSIKDPNGTILYQNLFQNKGCKTLFRFLCMCLAGDYLDAEKYRPLKIRIFNYNGTPAAAREQFNANDFESNLIPLSGEITTDTVAKVEVNNSDADEANVTFHFIIPFAYLINLEKNINVMMLYPSSVGRDTSSSDKNALNKKGLLAYYLCTTLNKETNIEEWASIISSEISDKDNTNLIIEWKMSILNIN